MEFSTTQLKVFRVVAERCNFTRAAEELYMTQPGVSGVISKLEQSIGTALFEQIGKRVYLTAAGEAMLEYAKRLIALADDADNALSEFRKGGRGRLLLGACQALGVHVLPGLLLRFKAAHPQIDISVEIGNDPQIIAGVVNNRVDLGLIAADVAHRDLQVVRFLTDDMVLIVPPTHSWVQRREVLLEELANEPFVGRERGSSTRTVVEREVNRLGYGLNISVEMSSDEAVKKAVETGLGVSIVWERTVAEALALGRLCKLTIDGMRFRRDSFVVYHTNKYRTRTVREFMDLLTAETAGSLDGKVVQ